MANPVEDELAIRHLVNAYADAVNRVDKDLWSSTWAEDGTWELPGAGEFSGRDNIVGLWTQAMGGFQFVAQLIYNGTLEISGDSASGRWYLAEHLRPQGSDGGMFNIGTYADEYIKVNGEWKFKTRRYHVLYNDEGKGDMTGMINPLPQ